jgi:ubiquinone/menaquinone biosynthesis C-methylase UbiE
LIAEGNFKDDLVVAAVIDIASSHLCSGSKERLQVLEVGCGEARRLAWLAENQVVDVFGIEPSAMAVEKACSRGVNAQRGAADSLPFHDAQFDIVIFGFYLYLCDRQDLFLIAKEADRVLKPDAWLVVSDFFSPAPVRWEYRHRPGVFS